jgi:hypothetical protein
MSDTTQVLTSETIPHGIENACYSGGPGEPYYQPSMECMCGWTTGRCASWEDAGRIFDVHMASVI